MDFCPIVRYNKSRKRKDIKNMRYYSALRPVSLGTYPKYTDNEVIEIKNFDQRVEDKELGKRYWGWVEYEHEIPEQDACRYDLVK